MKKRIFLAALTLIFIRSYCSQPKDPQSIVRTCVEQVNSSSADTPSERRELQRFRAFYREGDKRITSSGTERAYYLFTECLHEYHMQINP